MIDYLALPLHENLCPVDKQAYEQWLQQFDTFAEQCIADSLYHNIRQLDFNTLRPLCVQLWQKLKQRPDLNLQQLRFTALGSAKSGHLVSYFFRQATGLPNQSFISWAEAMQQVQKGEQAWTTLVLLDDILSSGNQMKQFFQQGLSAAQKAALAQHDITVVLAPLLMSCHGEAYLKQWLATAAFEFSIQFEYATRLLSLWEQPQAYEEAPLRAFLAKTYQRFSPDETEYHINLERNILLLTMAYNVPGSLLLPFHQQTPTWQPLLKRWDTPWLADTEQELQCYRARNDMEVLSPVVASRFASLL